VQLYEIDDAAVELVLRTFASVFEHAAVWSGSGSELLLLGFDRSDRASDLQRLAARVQLPDFKAALARAGVRGLPGLLAHELLPLGTLQALYGEQGPLHTQRHPRLSDLAARAFFRDDDVATPMAKRPPADRIAAEGSLLRRYLSQLQPLEAPRVWPALVEEVCDQVPDYCATFFALWRWADPSSRVRESRLEARRRDPDLAASLHPLAMDRLADFLAGAARGRGPIPLEVALETSELFFRSAHHAAPFRRAALAGIWDRCRDPDGEAGLCEETRAEIEERFGPLAPAPAPGPR
jgi:hypothetical protein